MCAGGREGLDFGESRRDFSECAYFSLNARIFP